MRHLFYMTVVAGVLAGAYGENFADGKRHVLAGDVYDVVRVDAEVDRVPGTHVVLADLTPYVSGGSGMGLDCYVNHHGKLTVYAGGKDTFPVNCNSENDALVTIEDSVIGYFHAKGNSRVVIRGGQVRYLYPRDGATVHIHGRNFTLDGKPVLYGPVTFKQYHPNGFYYGQLGGFLANGTQLDMYSNAVPGPASGIVLVPADSCPEADFTGDCKVDFADLAEFAMHWLTCGLDYPALCWP